LTRLLHSQDLASRSTGTYLELLPRLQTWTDPALYASSAGVASYHQIDSLSRGEEGSARSTHPSRTPLEPTTSVKNEIPPSPLHLQTRPSQRRTVPACQPHLPSRPAGLFTSSSPLSYHLPQRAASPANESKTKPLSRLSSRSDRGSSRTTPRPITSTMMTPKLRLPRRHPSVQAEGQPSGHKPKNRHQRNQRTKT
jgi:hypothetical protein